MRIFQLCLLVLTTNLALAETPVGTSPLLDLFPASSAPSFLDKPSEFVVSQQFRLWTSRSKWAEGLDEKKVFHVYLTHRSVAERSWEIRIGKGGQMYSLVSSFGEAMPPQSLENPWMDEVWHMVAVNDDLLEYLPTKDGRRGELIHETNSFIHQAGMYTSQKQNAPSAPFYSPMLAQSYRADQRSYAVMSWGQIPTPSVRRGLVLFYTQFRDLGGGVLEASYVCFDFGGYAVTSLDSPWGGVRTSVFPELVLADAGGQPQFHSAYYEQGDGYAVDTKDTGGWAAATQNAADPHGYALGLVFGRDQHWRSQSVLEKAAPDRFQRTPTVYASGDSRHGPRDYTVMEVSNRINCRIGETFFRRVYFIIGTLAEVTEKAKALEAHADYHPLVFDEDDTPLLPIYSRKVANGQLVPTLEMTSKSDVPMCFTYARPVEGSKPLFLMQETATGKYAISTDPYLFCARIAVKNPYPEDDPRHATFENRPQYLTYDGKTKWIDIMGYVMPREKADEKKLQYVGLDRIAPLAELFQPGESDKAKAFVVRTSN